MKKKHIKFQSTKTKLKYLIDFFTNFVFSTVNLPFLFENKKKKIERRWKRKDWINLNQEEGALHLNHHLSRK